MNPIKKEINEIEIESEVNSKREYEKPEITIQMPMETRTGSDLPS
ncbi:MAG TPA: hypothetical protein VLB84_10055 [Bacteroidia bacterium]|nr:hypothetical protein [Bacteroidia bacterium]